MSKHSTSGSPASSASSSAPPTPPAGPDRTVSAACAAAREASVSPPEDCMICGSGSPPARELLATGGAGRPRAAARAPRRAPSWRCARTRGRCPPGRTDSDTCASGSSSAQQLAEHALVPGIGVGVEQGRPQPPAGARAARRSTSSRAGPSGRARAAGRPGPCARARRSAAAAARAAPAPRAHSLYRCGPRLASELDHVGEAVGRDQRGARRAALQQRVRRDGHPVGEALDLARLARPRARARGAPPRAPPPACPAGVEGTFAVWTLEPSPTSTASVKVPPTSTPRSTASAYARPGGAPSRALRRRRARGPRCRRGAGGRGSSRCAAAACAGRQSPCGSSRGTAVARR